MNVSPPSFSIQSRSDPAVYGIDLPLRVLRPSQLVGRWTAGQDATHCHIQSSCGCPTAGIPSAHPFARDENITLELGDDK